MSYSTVGLVRRALVPTLSEAEADNVPTTSTRTAADFTNDQLQDAINEADAMIEGYVSRFYVVPVQPVTPPNPDDLDNDSDLLAPHPIDYWSRNIAAYNATLVYRGSLDFADTDPVARRYKDTLFQLQQVSKGMLQLPIATNTGDQAAQGAGSAINPYCGELFTLDEFDLKPPNFDPVYGAFPQSPYYCTP